MLRTASTIKGYAIAASDGVIGTVSDFLFDDTRWSVRWLVVATGSFFTRREVLLPTSAVTHLSPDEKQFSVDLTIQQVKNSPDVDTNLPVSRQTEGMLYDSYGWSPYWGRGAFAGGYGFVSGGMQDLPSPGSWREQRDVENLDDGDPHLRSIAAVTGYHIEATDGDIGHVEDFLLRDGKWHIDYLVVDTNNWWPGKKVLISPASIKSIDWADRSVEISVARQTVKDSPAYDPSTAIDASYEKQFSRHYE